MDAAIRHPARPAWVAIGTQPPLLSQEAERIECGQPLKPFRRIGRKRKLTMRWADHHRRTRRRRGDGGKDAGTSSRRSWERRRACSAHFAVRRVWNGSLLRGGGRGRWCNRRCEERFQYRETLLSVLLALAKQFQSEAGELFLEGGHLCLQMQQRLAQIGLSYARTG